MSVPDWLSQRGLRVAVVAATVLATGAVAWRFVAPRGPERPGVIARFGGALRALPDEDAATPPAPLAEAPQPLAEAPPPPPFLDPPQLRAGAEPDQPEPSFAPDTPLARAAPHILALAPADQRPPSPFDELETLLPPIRPRFDDLIEPPAPPLPPRRPRDLVLTPPAPAQQPATAPAPPSVVALAPTAVPPTPPPAPSVAPAKPDLAKPPELTAPAGPAGTGQAGSPVFVRIFKREGVLELYVRQNGRFALKKSYPVCKMSGRVGPKVKSGDYQAPEGFYSVTARQLNPKSQYHLAFNVGFPNAFDRQNGRTGSAIMVHGDCVSVGCFAMTNKGIEEIYGYVAAALKNGQREVPVHIFPFRMTESAIARESGAGFASLFSAARDDAPAGGAAQWGEFWRDLKKGYDLFERSGEPPLAYACKGRYAFSPGPGCQRIAGW